MQDVCKRINDIWDEQGYSLAEMVSRTKLSESTLRRFRAGDKGVTMDTVVTVARAVGVTIDALAESMPAPAAVAVKMLEDEYRPGGNRCATACPARKGMNETIELIRELHAASTAREKELYERAMAEKQELYERALTEKNLRLGRFRKAAYVLLALFAASIIFSFYLVFYDFPRSTWGILQYPSRVYFDSPSANSAEPGRDLQTLVRWIENT